MRPTASNRSRYLPRWRKQKTKSWPLFCNRKALLYRSDICYSDSVQGYIEVWNVSKISNISLWEHFLLEPCFSLANEKLVDDKYTKTEEKGINQDLELPLRLCSIKKRYCNIHWTTEEKDHQDLKFPVSSFSSSLAKGTKAWPRPVLLPLRPWGLGNA